MDHLKVTHRKERGKDHGEVVGSAAAIITRRIVPELKGKDRGDSGPWNPGSNKMAQEAKVE